LIPQRLLEPEPAHSRSSQNPRHRRERHPERLGDLGCREAQPAQRRDRLDPLWCRAVRDPVRRRGTIGKTELALGSVPTKPLPSTAQADPGGLGHRRQASIHP
jgi:hypothetical protein